MHRSTKGTNAGATVVLVLLTVALTITPGLGKKSNIIFLLTDDQVSTMHINSASIVCVNSIITCISVIDPYIA